MVPTPTASLFVSRSCPRGLQPLTVVPEVEQHRRATPLIQPLSQAEASLTGLKDATKEDPGVETEGTGAAALVVEGRTPASRRLRVWIVTCRMTTTIAGEEGAARDRLRGEETGEPQVREGADVLALALAAKGEEGVADRGTMRAGARWLGAGRGIRLKSWIRTCELSSPSLQGAKEWRLTRRRTGKITGAPRTAPTSTEIRLLRPRRRTKRSRRHRRRAFRPCRMMGISIWRSEALHHPSATVQSRKIRPQLISAMTQARNYD